MRDTYILFVRLMRHILRSPDTIMTVAIMPIALMLMFVFVFGGAIKESLPADVSYIAYQLPGILLITVASGIAYTSMRLWSDTQRGMFARFHSMPVKRSSLLWSHVLASLLSSAMTLALVFAVALLLGFRSNASLLNWFICIGMLMLFTLTLTWIAVIPGLKARSMEGATAFSYPLMFLPFLSSAFVPTSTMPSAVRVFAENQPTTSFVNTIRALLSCDPVGNDIWVALAWCVGISAIACVVALRVYRQQRHELGTR